MRFTAVLLALMLLAGAAGAQHECPTTGYVINNVPSGTQTELFTTADNSEAFEATRLILWYGGSPTNHIEIYFLEKTRTSSLGYQAINTVRPRIEPGEKFEIKGIQLCGFQYTAQTGGIVYYMADDCEWDDCQDYGPLMYGTDTGVDSLDLVFRDDLQYTTYTGRTSLFKAKSIMIHNTDLLPASMEFKLLRCRGRYPSGRYSIDKDWIRLAPNEVFVCNIDGICGIRTRHYASAQAIFFVWASGCKGSFTRGGP